MPRGALVLFLGATLLVVGVLVYGPAPAAGFGLVIVGAVLLGAFYLYSGVQNRRTPGWTRVVNPGAAYREAKAERAALALRATHDETVEGDDPEGQAPTPRD